MELSRRLGYNFRDSALLQQALTHRSYAHGNNERLEFLGDGLLNFVIGERLYSLQPKAEEGALSRLRASLVREETLARLGRDLQLGELLRLGESELKSGGYRRDSILADAVEAVIGAVYLDGGFEAARAVCERLYAPLLADLPDAESLKDPKTRLQEALQADGRPLPRYEILSESGPPHARRFAVRCLLPDNESFTESEGASRRSAEQRAAELMIAKIHA
ncbi:ribonuclease III [Solimonas fluminis]|uniref:Ribonuclease 3 n=1 Tax=Solimonas fluminis TaxID=2086571 RepID=A0A2S5TM37_9GAMM|nr:ribonuclease III [Solimonas fluminis]PPE75828.1 ribonuclease III [Solimonas fluminis]